MTCYFCQKNTNEIDFKNADVLSKFISSAYKIKNRKKTGLCAMHQRGVSKAIKRARQLGIMPYLPK
ncbi:30S ribosomal protein S18 [Patescibacteria group bacterium]|nr:30S ribosomal protein S18 [Patescibacteria group bacterium]